MNRLQTNNQDTKQDATEKSNQNTAIDASDSSRNDERDQRIKEEQGTERLRSERESTMNRDPK